MKKLNKPKITIKELVIEKEVTKASESGGHVLLPKELIGKIVVIKYVDKKNKI